MIVDVERGGILDVGQNEILNVGQARERVGQRGVSDVGPTWYPSLLDVLQDVGQDV